MSKMAIEPSTKYAITMVDTTLGMHFSKEAPSETFDNFKANSINVRAGKLLKVYQSNTPGAPKKSTVQVLDYERHDPIFANCLFECAKVHMQKVDEDLWPFVIAICEPERRLKFLRNKELCRFVIYLKKNDMVSVPGKWFGKDNSVQYVCIIRYIGPIEELHAVGYCFGLELLDPKYGNSPQQECIPYCETYTNCDPSLSLLVTADQLSPISNDTRKKFSAFDYINDTVGKVKSAIDRNICVNGPSNTSSLRREKKLKNKEPTACFYGDQTITPSALRDNPFDTADLTDKPVKNSPTSTMEKRTQTQKSKSNLADSEPILPLESDDYKQSIEKYEKTVERQHAGNASSVAAHNSNTSDLVNIPTAQQQPAGILKHRRTPSASGKDDLGNLLKSPGLFNFEDRDIVVIDNADIRNATQNESSVVVVKNPHAQKDMDLMELLGTNWPTTAGDAANILNKSHKPSESSSSLKNDRVKSSNILSHFAAQKSSQDRGHRMLEKSNPTFADVLKKREHLATQLANERKRNIPSYVNVYDADNYDNVELPTTIAPLPPPQPATAAPPDVDFIESSPLQEVPETGLGVGSMVEVSVPESPDDLYGVIRWIGMPPGANGVMVGVELEDDNTNKQLLATDGTFNGVPLFKCHEGRALFVHPNQCLSDKRFLDVDGAAGGAAKITNNHHENNTDSKMFGQVECPSVPGAVAPLKILSLEDLEEICGKFKGIQGHHNSCYLDATLFSMFAFTSVFDSLLFRPPEPEDISHYTEVQKVLREEIVNPLRRNTFVRADRVMKLRQLLDKLSSVSGLMSEEKDPEEFINSLLAQIMRVEPFLKLSSGQDAYFYQLFVEKDERLSFPTVQQLFEQSFHSSDIKLKEVPSCLIIQMPRFGKNYKMYPRILPSQVLDVTDIIEDSPRQCTVCGKLAEFECHDCFGILQGGAGLECTAFCGKCSQTVHMHAKRTNHTPKKLSVPQDFRIMAEHMNVPRLYMELFAVVCIETSHYVAFVKAGCGPDAPWCFFDSMADRKGEQNGYNIPEMITVPDMPQWLSEDGARIVNETSSNDKMLPEHAKRLFCDAYMCMYQSTDVMMYR